MNYRDLPRILERIESDAEAICKELKFLAKTFQNLFPARVGKKGFELICSNKCAEARFNPQDLLWKNYDYIQFEKDGKLIFKRRHGLKSTLLPLGLKRRNKNVQEIIRGFHRHKVALVRRRRDLLEARDRVLRTLRERDKDASKQATQTLLKASKQFRSQEVAAWSSKPIKK